MSESNTSRPVTLAAPGITTDQIRQLRDAINKCTRSLYACKPMILVQPISRNEQDVKCEHCGRVRQSSERLGGCDGCGSPLFKVFGSDDNPYEI